MQKITIEDLIVPTLIGGYDWERKSKTNLRMSVQIWANVSRAMHSDNVADTLDYAAIAENIKASAAETSFALLEALGRVVCEHLLDNFAIEKLYLDIEKPDILPDAKKVCVSFAYDKQGVMAYPS